METSKLFNKIVNYANKQYVDINHIVGLSPFCHDLEILDEAKRQLYLNKLKKLDNEILFILKCLPRENLAKLLAYRSPFGWSLQNFLSSFNGSLKNSVAYIEEQTKVLNLQTSKRK